MIYSFFNQKLVTSAWKQSDFIATLFDVFFSDIVYLSSLVIFTIHTLSTKTSVQKQWRVSKNLSLFFSNKFFYQQLYLSKNSASLLNNTRLCAPKDYRNQTPLCYYKMQYKRQVSKHFYIAKYLMILWIMLEYVLLTENVCLLNFQLAFHLQFVCKKIQWIFQFFFGWDLGLNLDNFVTFLPAIESISDKIWMEIDHYDCFTDLFGIPQQKNKDFEETIVLAFGIKVDIKIFLSRFLF